MTKLAEQLKQGADHAWDSLSEGWRELSARASGALTRFLSTPPANSDSAAGPPSASSTSPGWGSAADMPWSSSWAFMAADVFDDDDKVVVRVEAPGMRREDFQVELHQDTLVVRGEKQLQRESGTGRYRFMQCAYGNFHREVALPAAVQADKARASYRDGVLRVELPKSESAKARRIAVG